ncbi:uncharacterized protein [Linepithema humile]|uniref:uncharacterized protein n=1 Tax=Linepithema humile TaxID=83485 RepID=UPI00351EFF67
MNQCLLLSLYYLLFIKITKNYFGSDINSNIIIMPDNFNSQSTLDDKHKKWFVNLSDVVIPKEVELLLQLGERFNMPITEKMSMSIEVIKNIERNIERKSEDYKCSVRNDTISIINGFCKGNSRNSVDDRKLLNWLYKTKKFINENPDLLFTRADKGNSTVVMKKSEYMEKMVDILSDTNTYQIVKKDPTKILTDKLRSLLARWRERGYIDDIKYRCLLETDGNTPRAYGLPKIHKEGYPLRVIVSSINSPLYKIANFLHGILANNVPNSKRNIKNSFDLVEKLNGVFLESDHCLASLDVVSLFTNIPVEKAIESIKNRWEWIRRYNSIPIEEFLIGINLVLNSTYFSFNKVIYKQIFGTPMGSPLSPIIAEFMLQDLENSAIERLPYKLPFYFRYVDDILFTAPENHLDEVLETFNSMHSRLQFTLEKGINNHINFLNVKLISENNFIKFDLFHKPTFSGRYLSFYSHHPMAHKKGVIIGLFDRVVKLTHPQYWHKNIEEMISLLLINGYPLELIFNSINERLKKI